MSLLVHARNLQKWPLLTSMDDDTRANLEKFTYFGWMLFGVTRDHKFFTYGNYWKDLAQQQGPMFFEIQQLAGKKVMECVQRARRFMVRTEDGQLWAWGSNRFGRLGTGNESISWYDTPQLIFEVGILSVQCGINHTIALHRNGKVFTWGGGPDCIKMQLRPTPVQLDFERKLIIQIGCTTHSSWALSSDGDVFCWWSGISDEQYSRKPTLLVPTKMETDQKFKWIVCGRSTSILLTLEGHIYVIIGKKNAVLLARTHLTFEKIYHSQGFYFGLTNTRAMYFWREKDFPKPQFHRTYSHIPPTEQDWWLRPHQFKLDCTQVNFSVPDFISSYTNQAHSPVMFEYRNIDPDMFDSPDNSDLTFTFPGGETIFAHRLQLMASSDYMKSRLSELWAPTDVVPIETYNYNVFYKYIKYLYTGLLELDSLEEAQVLLDLAHSFVEDGLLDTCLDWIVQHYLNADTCHHLHTLANTYGLEEFGSKVLLYMHGHFQKD